jgi:hypothetical protein
MEVNEKIKRLKADFEEWAAILCEDIRACKSQISREAIVDAIDKHRDIIKTYIYRAISDEEYAAAVDEIMALAAPVQAEYSERLLVSVSREDVAELMLGGTITTDDGNVKYAKTYMTYTVVCVDDDGELCVTRQNAWAGWEEAEEESLLSKIKDKPALGLKPN